MGSISMSVPSFRAILSELLGVKAGLAVGLDELNALLLKQDTSAAYAGLEEDEWLRIDSVSFEETVEDLLFTVGRLRRRRNPLPGIAMHHRYKNDPSRYSIAIAVQELHLAWMKDEIPKAAKRENKLMDPSGFLEDAAGAHGKAGLDLALELLEDQSTYLFKSPYSLPQVSEWKDVLELKALFESEALDTQYGSFFDQRFIDFLNRNFDSIDGMHWRKFEQLTAEYLEREGYRVELGPGRGDDGIDVRAWPQVDTATLPPAIVVQCKRQKATIEKVIVKSLYADVLAEKAQSGMIVTTSRLSVGARQTSIARQYPIQVADRSTLKEWLAALHTPGSGVITDF